MAADRWYYLRHPEGFSDDLFGCVCSGLSFWRADVEARLRHWEHSGLKGAPPTYEWYDAEISVDRKLVTIPVGGAGTYGSYHLLEETVPGFHRYLPPWFLVDLDVGRRDRAGWFPEISWTPVVAPEKRNPSRNVCRRPSASEWYMRQAPANNRMELPAPLGGRAGNGALAAAASCPPFGGHLRRSSSTC